METSPPGQRPGERARGGTVKPVRRRRWIEDGFRFGLDGEKGLTIGGIQVELGSMVGIAKRFIQTFKKLPPEKQEYYGIPFLEAIEADQKEDQKWEAAFAETTDEQWEKMAERARKQHRRGESLTLDDFLAA